MYLQVQRMCPARVFAHPALGVATELHADSAHRDYLRLSALELHRLRIPGAPAEISTKRSTRHALVDVVWCVQDWQNKCTKIFVNTDVVEEWSRIATAMNEVGKGKSKGEDAAKEMMELLEAELKTVHDVMGKKWRCVIYVSSIWLLSLQATCNTICTVMHIELLISVKWCCGCMWLPDVVG